MAEEIVHDEKSNIFYIKHNSKESHLRYTLRGEDTIDMYHTYVPLELRGHSIASKLAKEALEYAKNKNLKVIPSCSFVRSYMMKNKEYLELVREV